jgi:N utilization substance protein B
MTTPPEKRSGRGTRGRSIARKLAMQALYQWQLNASDAKELIKQYGESDEAAGVDADYFADVVAGCVDGNAQIVAIIAGLIDRPLEQLDPVERAILMIGVFELQQRADVPYRVVINEGVDLCKRFGATDAHKYINAVLDRAAKQLRTAEQQAPS